MGLEIEVRDGRLGERETARNRSPHSVHGDDPVGPPAVEIADQTLVGAYDVPGRRGASDRFLDVLPGDPPACAGSVDAAEIE